MKIHLPIIGIIAMILSSCDTQTVTMTLTPSSEAQIGFEKSYVSEELHIQKVVLPKKASILVPFMVQAPLADWNAPYQESCEEASIIMMDYFLRNAELNSEQANREILQLTQWEEANRYKYDVSLSELKDIVENYYGYRARISHDVSIASIMYEIAKGNPVIVPTAGRDLGNPYFSGDGPWYHMLVITGYNRTYFITNDPGTRHGDGYKYKKNTLFSAIHDWTGIKEDIINGPKRMMIIEK